MADPISAASGVLALVTFSAQATVSLVQLIQDFRKAPNTVRQLKEELTALDGVLQSLRDTIDQTDSKFSELKIPLYQCGKACQDFESVLSRKAGTSSGAKTHFQEWTKLKFHGSDINGFRETIAGYKATISIALCTVNLRSSNVTVTALNEYKEMITNTACDLENRLQNIDEQLRALASLGAANTNESPNVREQMREEKDSILKCLEICNDVSNHIDTLRARHPNLPTSSRGADRDVTTVPAVAAWLEAARHMVECKQELETHTQALRTKVTQQAARLSLETEQTRRRELIEEVESLQKSLEICNNAYKEAEQNRTNVFEDVSAGEDGSQVIASTVGDLIFAKKIKIGSRSVQMLGQMSDLTIQQVTNRYTKDDHSRPLEHRSASFEGRYGTGRDLHSPKARGQQL